jgi:SAM-dependent methyltransferase
MGQMSGLRGREFAIPHPLIPPEEMRNHSTEQYLASAVQVISLVDELVGIPRWARVLDVGCAAGRLALPLLEHLDEGSGGAYDGFDVKAGRIEWARQHITAFYPAFRFAYIDVANSTLNPSGTLSGSSVRFPYPDGSFDIALLHSVFTHLLPADAWHYLSELRRCLRREGKIYSTWYLWDDMTAESIRGHDVLWDFPTGYESHRVMDVARPELAVAYVRDQLMAHIEESGLRVATERRGDWRSKPTHDQDILILARGDESGQQRIPDTRGG